MCLQPGQHLGAYEVVAAIGAGGMSEVYRAHDTKLHRDVALKILPDVFALDPDRLARFEREAQRLASLNHPNIAGIYGLEEAGGVKALALELVEGPTLADRIAQGPIPADEALPMEPGDLYLRAGERNSCAVPAGRGRDRYSRADWHRSETTRYAGAVARRQAPGAARHVGRDG
jgi:protein kinase-like protein